MEFWTLLKGEAKDFIRCPKQFFQVVLHVHPSSCGDEKDGLWEVKELACQQKYAPDISLLRTYKIKKASINRNRTFEKSDTDADYFVARSAFKSGTIYLLDVTGSVTSKEMVSLQQVPVELVKELPSLTLLARLSLRTDNHDVVIYMDAAVAICLVGDTVHVSYVQLFMDENREIKAAASPISEFNVISRAALPSDSHPRVVNMTCYEEYNKVVEDVAWNMQGSPENTHFITSCTPSWLMRMELSATASKMDAKLVCTMNDGSCNFMSVLYDHNVAILLNIRLQEWEHIHGMLAKDRGQVLITKNKPDEEPDPLRRLLICLFTKACMSYQRRMKVKVLSTDYANERKVPYRVCVDREKNHWATFHTSTHDSLFAKVVTIQSMEPC